MLEIENLEVNYGHIEAVRGIDLRVGMGQVVALLGPNAAGKTSTLRAISGLVDYQGRITFDGLDVRRTGTRRLARAGLIHVPEGRRVFPNLTVHENLQIGFSARAGRSTWSLADIYDLFPPLVHLRARGGWALSGGEQQMVAIGRALAASPRLLMLDEPSLGLAPVLADAVYERLADVAKTVPVLLVEQNTAMALRVCDRASVLVSGRITMEGEANEIAERGDLLASFLGQASV
jgi:branched-chain amino acid transport system ATP-binding protein